MVGESGSTEALYGLRTARSLRTPQEVLLRSSLISCYVLIACKQFMRGLCTSMWALRHSRTAPLLQTSHVRLCGRLKFSSRLRVRADYGGVVHVAITATFVSFSGCIFTSNSASTEIPVCSSVAPSLWYSLRRGGVHQRCDRVIH